jgi:hypothetical protein
MQSYNELYAASKQTCLEVDWIAIPPPSSRKQVAGQMGISTMRYNAPSYWLCHGGTEKLQHITIKYSLVDGLLENYKLLVACQALRETFSSSMCLDNLLIPHYHPGEEQWLVLNHINQVIRTWCVWYHPTPRTRLICFIWHFLHLHQIHILLWTLYWCTQ